MNKKTKITSLTTAALATVLLAGANWTGSVKADTIKDANTNSTQKSKSPKETVQDNIKSAQTKVEQAQTKVSEASKNLNNAKKDAQTPDKAYADQDAQVKKAKADLDSKKNEATKAQSQVDDAQKLIEQATTANIAAAKKAVEDKNVEINKKQTDLTNTQGQLPTKQAAIDNANSNVEKAKDSLKVKNTDKAAADTAVKNAQDALKGTGINEAEDAVNTYKNNIKNLNDNISSNKNVLANNQNVLKENQAKLTDIKNNQLSGATKAQQNAEKAKNNAQIALNDAKDKLKQDQAFANSAAGFFKSLADNTSLTDEQREDARMAYSVVMNEGEFQGLKLNWYNEAVQLGQDGDATSLKQMKSALYDLDDLVKVRQAYGLNIPKVSLAATAVAMMSSDFTKMRINKEGSSFYLQHPVRMYDQYGLFFMSEEDIFWSTPSGSVGKLHGSRQVREYMHEIEYINAYIEAHPEAKKYRYDIVKPLTQEKWQQNREFWNSNIVGKYIGHYNSMIKPTQNSVGAAIATQYDDNQDKSDILGSFEVLSYWHPSFTIDEYKNLVNSYTPENASFIQSDKNDIANKQANVNNTQTALETAKAKVTDLQNTIDSFNVAIANTQKVINDTQAAIKSANEKLPIQQKNLTDAESRLAALTASNEQKTANLIAAQTKQEAAKKAVNEAQNQLDNANTELKKANEAKNNLENEISNKQAALEKAQNELKDLTAKRDALINAPQILKNAQGILKSANAAVTAAETTLTAAQTKLNNLQKPKDEADAKVAQAQNDYDQANKDLNEAQSKLTKAQDALAEIERQEQATAELATQEAQAQAEAAKKAAELKQASDEAKTVTLAHNAYVYDKNGNAIKVNGESKKLSKGDAIKTYSNAKVVTINGKKFYQIGENEFVKIANTVAPNAKKSTATIFKSAKLTHNAFIYDKNGKRVKLTWIKRGSIIKPTSLITIKGKKYYQIGKNKFVKVANTKIKTHSVKKTATIKAKLNHKVATVDRSGGKNSHHVLGMRTYKFNEKLVIKGKTCYKITGKNDWIAADKLNFKR